MPISRLTPHEEAELKARRLTYDEVGATSADLPPGYRHLRRERQLVGTDFDAAGHALMRWQIPLRSGLAVAASAPVAALDTVVVLRLGIGRMTLRIPCRVVYVVDEPDCKAFAYGTLEGHPETGEKAFFVTRHDDGSVAIRIEAFSNPARPLARLGGPATRLVQSRITDRYMSALDHVRRSSDLA